MLKLSEQMKKETHVTSHFEFTFQKGGHKGESYEADILVASISMTELCTTLRLEISSLEKPYFFYIIGLDTENEIPAVLDASSIIEKNFTKAFIAELDKEDWNFFKMYNKVLRNVKSEEFTDFSTLEVDFTDYVQTIEKETYFISYQYFFPNVKFPSILYKGERYYIEDEYYITHNILTANCGLSCMVREKDGSFDWENPKSRLAGFDYETQSFTTYKEGVYFDQSFFIEVKKQLPDLASLLKTRHDNLRLVYENYCKRSHLHFPAPVSSVQNGKPLNSLLPPKVGRNDPCPCGSGKKYKKCCMS